MEVEEPAAGSLLSAPAVEPAKEGKPEGTKAASRSKPPAPPSQYMVPNASRVTPGQAPLVEFVRSSRWKPLESGRAPVGIVVLKDSTPGARCANGNSHTAELG